ncbi:hypothetical protein pphageT12_61 [Pseudomonas phage pphageT12]|nr:hypothetical protein pphageT12_61 [Pseudomonas phage pphageT12]
MTFEDTMTLLGCVLLFPFVVVCIACTTDDRKDPRRN